jgi:hypothetical protein
MAGLGCGGPGLVANCRPICLCTYLLGACSFGPDPGRNSKYALSCLPCWYVRHLDPVFSYGSKPHGHLCVPGSNRCLHNDYTSLWPSRPGHRSLDRYHEHLYANPFAYATGLRSTTTGSANPIWHSGNPVAWVSFWPNWLDHTNPHNNTVTHPYLCMSCSNGCLYNNNACLERTWCSIWRLDNDK